MSGIATEAARPAGPPRQPGDEVRIVSPGHSAAGPDRLGTIVRVFASARTVHYLVRWYDGRESVVPASVLLPIEAEGPGEPGPSA